jgi:nicotinamidase-related amidase
MMLHRLSLLIIDPQKDFHPGGSLAVPGSDEDAERIAKFIEDNVDSLDEIVVTLDSHHTTHIAHMAFWRDANGASPNPFTLITNADVKEGKWLPRDSQHNDWALEYTSKLDAAGKFTLCIWPDHCLIGSPGHNIVDCIFAALMVWARANQVWKY